MKSRTMIAALLASLAVALLATGCSADPLPPVFRQAQAEYDNRICRARSKLAGLAIDYLSALDQLNETRELYRWHRTSETLVMLCTLQRADGGADCPAPPLQALFRAQAQVEAAAAALRGGLSHYHHQVEQIQREFHRAFGLVNTAQRTPQGVVKPLLCKSDPIIDRALRHLSSTR